MLILEVREVKRLSKKVREKYVPVTPGSFVSLALKSGEQVVIHAHGTNTQTMYAGHKRGF
jgi:prefoldin subunit 5